MNISPDHLRDLIGRQEALWHAVNLAIHEQHAISQALFPTLRRDGGSLNAGHLATAGDVLVLLRDELAALEEPVAA